MADTVVRLWIGIVQLELYNWSSRGQHSGPDPESIGSLEPGVLHLPFPVPGVATALPDLPKRTKDGDLRLAFFSLEVELGSTKATTRPSTTRTLFSIVTAGSGHRFLGPIYNDRLWEGWGHASGPAHHSLTGSHRLRHCRAELLRERLPNTF